MVMDYIFNYLGLMKLGDFSVVKNKYVHLLTESRMSLMKCVKFKGNYPKNILYKKIKEYYDLKNEHKVICAISEQNGYNYRIHDTKLRIVDYGIFATLISYENVQLLSFSNCNITDRSFELLLDCKFQYLKDLDLTRNVGITNYVIEIISRFNTTTEFTTLTINECNVDSDGIYRITQNEKFRYIKIFAFRFRNGVEKGVCDRKWFYNMGKLKMLTFKEDEIKNYEKIEYEKPHIVLNVVTKNKPVKRERKSDNDSTRARK